MYHKVEGPILSPTALQIWNYDRTESLPYPFQVLLSPEETKGTKCIKALFCTHRSDYIP